MGRESESGRGVVARRQVKAEVVLKHRGRGGVGVVMVEERCQGDVGIGQRRHSCFDIFRWVGLGSLARRIFVHLICVWRKDTESNQLIS